MTTKITRTMATAIAVVERWLYTECAFCEGAFHVHLSNAESNHVFCSRKCEEDARFHFRVSVLGIEAERREN